MLDISKIKSDFPIFKNKIHSKDLVYLDSAATSQKPQIVIDALVEYYENSNANIHRGVYYLSEKSTELYEHSRSVIANFLGSSDSNEITFTKNATESLNLVAFSFINTYLDDGDIILISKSEHHSNIIPWQIYAPSKKVQVQEIGVDEDGRIDFDDLKKKLSSKVKLISVGHASNSSGVIHDVERIIRLAHEKNIKVCVDASQSVPHMKINVKEMDCDFLAFTGHKMLGPTGIGVLYGKKKLLDEMIPYQGGGGMIQEVNIKGSTWAESPQKFEAGTPNIAGAIGLAKAIEYLDKVGMENILAHELKLTEKILDSFREDPNIEIFGPKNMKDRCGIISFGIKGIHPHDIATILDQEGIAIRAGHHCAQLMMNLWNTVATARLSLYLYNSEEDVEKFLMAIEKAKFIFGVK